MSDIQVTVNGVLKLLAGIDVKKSTGPDELSPRVLKESREEIAPVLTFIFNQSLSAGAVPEDWLLVNIFALHKKGPKDLPENYRPISLTSICSKIIEHIVHSSICRFLEENNILTPRQHGFRSGHSCETQLILAIDDWARALNSGSRTDVAIFDFSIFRKPSTRYLTVACWPRLTHMVYEEAHSIGSAPSCLTADNV